jgi:hypothetical protein
MITEVAMCHLLLNRLVFKGTSARKWFIFEKAHVTNMGSGI